MMKINIADVTCGQDLEFSFDADAKEVDIPADVCEFEGMIRVGGVIQQTGAAYRIQGTIRCTKVFLCDRCLKPSMECQVHAFEEDFCLDGEQSEQESVILPEGEVIDITDLVRDTLLAAQPISNICKPDCRGLCPVCGTDLNLEQCDCEAAVPDPRLAVLKEFMSKKKQD